MSAVLYVLGGVLCFVGMIVDDNRGISASIFGAALIISSIQEGI